MAKKNTPATPAEVADGAQENEIQEGQEVLTDVAPPPAPLAGRFQYLSHAKVHSWYDSGVEVDLVFDADGFLNCETHALVNAVKRATVDPDLKPGRIIQVAVE